MLAKSLTFSSKSRKCQASNLTRLDSVVIKRLVMKSLRRTCKLLSNTLFIAVYFCCLTKYRYLYRLTAFTFGKKLERKALAFEDYQIQF